MKEILKSLDELDSCEANLNRVLLVGRKADELIVDLKLEREEDKKKIKRQKNLRNIFIGTTAVLGTVILLK